MPTLTSPTRHYFLSPHYDDIALSCGGTVTLLARAGLIPEIIVIFGEAPDPNIPLSPFAAAAHDAWELTGEEVIAGRRSEEATAGLILGATWRALPFLDAIYRERFYESSERLFGEPAPAEVELPTRVVSAVPLQAPPTPQSRVYVPLAIGGHVDHRHGFATGVTLDRAGWDVWFYEDLPYALHQGALEDRLAALAAAFQVVPAAIVDVGATWEVKIKAILAYSSQLATIFRPVGAGSSREEIDRVMRVYATIVGDQQHPAERFWRLVGACRSR